MSKYHKPQKLSAKPPKFSKHHLRADGLLLLSSALRSCLGRGVRPAVLGTLAVIASGVAAAQSTDVFAESITLTIPSEPLTLDITPTAEGTFQESGAANFSVTTDALAGYKLTINSQNGSNALINSEGGDNLQSIESPIAEAEAASSFVDNRWGYLPSKFEGSDNTSYRPGPNGTATTLDATSAKNGGSPTNYTIRLGAKVDTTIPYGTYSNTFVLTATANPAAYTITYDANGGSNPPTQRTGEVYDANSTVSLSSVAPTRSGYDFKGWCDTETTDETCSGTTYPAGSDYSITRSSTSITLYAMWKKAGPADLGNLGSMQSFSCSKITSLEDYGTVTDSRDSNTYKVAKLRDNRCWMIDNLRIAGKTLTSSNSDVSSSFTLPSSSTSGFSSSTANNVYVDSQYGGYYTWNAATAGTGNSATIEGSRASGSICPKGWRLPTETELDTLVTKYGGDSSTGSSALRATPVPGFVYAGSYYDSSPINRGSDGRYWSSTAYDSTCAHNLFFNSSSAKADYNFRYGGFSVRCVAKQ